MLRDRPDFYDKQNHKILRHGHLTFYLIKDSRSQSLSLKISTSGSRIFVFECIPGTVHIICSIQKQMISWYFKLLKITHFVEPCVHVADSWSRIASAFDHHVDVERLLDDEKSQVLAAKLNKIKYRNRFENHFSFKQFCRTVWFLPVSRELPSCPSSSHQAPVRTSHSH